MKETGRAWPPVWGGEAKVNVGNNMPAICDQRRTEIRIVGFQGVTREKVSGTSFLEEAIRRSLEGFCHGF